MAQRRDSWLVSGVQAIMSVTGAGQVLGFVIGPTLPWAERKSVKTATLQNDHNQKGHTECDHYQTGDTTLVKTATLFVQNDQIGWVATKTATQHVVKSATVYMVAGHGLTEMCRSGYQNGRIALVKTATLLFGQITSEMSRGD